MGLSLKKLFVGGVAAAIITTAAANTISASNNNKITVSPTKTTVNAGDTFDVKLKYEPGSDGIAAFTVDLKYDSSKVEVYEPTDDELDGKYSVSTKFDYVSYNYKYSSDSVRVTGYKAKNVTANSDLALVTFKVKKGVSGKIPLWIESDTVTTIESDGSLKEASVSLPTSSSPVNVSVKSAETAKPAVTTAKPKTTTAKPATTTAKSKTTTAKPAVTTAPKPTAEPKPESTKVTTAPAPETVSKKPLGAAKPPVSSETEGEVTKSPVSTEAPPEVTTAETTSEVTTTDNNVSTETDSSTENTEPVFSYTYDEDGDFTEREDANYNFRLSDYISDFSKAYDISIKVSSDNVVNGAISYNNIEGKVTTKSFKVSSGSEIWVISGVSMKEIDDIVYVPIYFMGSGATFTIESISVAEYGVEAAPDEDKEILLGTEDNHQPQDEASSDMSGSEPEKDEVSASVESDTNDTSADDDKAPGEDSIPDTGGIPAIVLIALPFIMVGVTAYRIHKIKKGIK